MSAVLYDHPGPKARRRIAVGTALGVLLLIGLLYLGYARLQSQGLLTAERWEVLLDGEVWEFLGRGLLATLQAAAVAVALAAVGGVLLMAARTSGSAWVRRPVGVVIELFRGLPVVLLMLFMALVLPVSLFWAVVIGLTIYNSAVVAEILRAGVVSLPRGQAEAAAALGLSRTQTLRLILLPQAVRRMLPTLVSQTVVILKDTSLGYIVGYLELLRSIQNLRDFFGSRTTLAVFVAGAAIYITVNLAISRFAVYLERRGNRKAAGGVAAAVPTGEDNASARPI